MTATRDNLAVMPNLSEGDIFTQVGELAKYISAMKKELQEFQPEQLTKQHLPEASQQLDAIISMTEQATQTIMDQMDMIGANNQRVRDILTSAVPQVDPDMVASVEDAMAESESSITRVLEACSFQDITGQRIQKIVRVMQEVERQILRIIVIFGLARNQGTLDAQTKKELEKEVIILNGPQLPGQAISQDDIDNMLAKLL